MPDSLKDRLSSDLQKAKTEGGTRATRIREIIQSAASQSLAELKEGSGELRILAGQSLSEVAQTLNPQFDPAEPEQPLFANFVNAIKNQFRNRIVNLDTELTVRYGDRYELLKQRFGNTRFWYKNAKANAEVTGVAPLQQKQIELETKVGEAGTSVAQKEQQIRQQVKEVLQSVVSKV